MHLFNEPCLWYRTANVVYWLQRKVLALALALKAWSLLTSLVISVGTFRYKFCGSEVSWVSWVHAVHGWPL